MNCHCRLVICFVGVFILKGVIASETKCSTNALKNGCEDPNESCYELSLNVTVGVCKCRAGYAKPSPNERCKRSIKPSPSPDPHGDGKQPEPAASGDSSHMSGSTVAAGILIPLMLIVAAAGLVYAARRYHWLHRLRQLRQRRYDEVRIGQEDDDDDPPIA